MIGLFVTESLAPYDAILCPACALPAPQHGAPAKRATDRPPATALEEHFRVLPDYPRR